MDGWRCDGSLIPDMVLSDVQKSGLLCLMDVAAGMEHLHSMGVLHVRPCLCSVPEPSSHTRKPMPVHSRGCSERADHLICVLHPHNPVYTHCGASPSMPAAQRACGMPPHMEQKICTVPYVDCVPHNCLWLHRPDPVCIRSLLTLSRDACVQGDLKGANVLLKSTMVSAWDPRGYVCKLADFGLSRVMEHNRTHVSTATFGTAA